MYGLTSHNGSKDIFSEMDRVFDNLMKPTFGGSSLLWGEPISINANSLKADLIEKEDSYEVRAEVPGLDKKDISLTYDNNYLSLKIEKEEGKEENTKYLRRERYATRLERSFYIPHVNRDSIEAKVENGILFVELPKLEEKKVKKIDIEVK